MKWFALLLALPLAASADIKYDGNLPVPTVTRQVSVSVQLHKLTFQMRNGAPDADSEIVCSQTGQAPLYDLSDSAYAHGHKSPAAATIAECTITMKGHPVKYQIQASMTIDNRAGKLVKQGLVSINALGPDGKMTYQWGLVSTTTLKEASLGTFISDYSPLKSDGSVDERVSADVEFNDPQ